MYSEFKWIALVLILAGGGSAQQRPSGHEFTVASIRSNVEGNRAGEGNERESIRLSPVTLTMHNVTLRSCIRWAFGVRDYQIAGPGWMDSQRYDLAANAPSTASTAEMKLMLQGLLEERFKLSLRRETKEQPVYALMPTKKPNKLKAVRSEDPSSLRPVDGAMQFRNFSMADLADQLGSRPFKLDRLVIDRTGLDGLYDFTVQFADTAAGLKHTLEGMEQANINATGTMLAILQEQLGLALKPLKAPVEALIVEHAEKFPSAN